MPIKRSARNAAWGVVFCLLAANWVVGARLYAKEPAANRADDPYEQVALFTHIIEQIRENYVETNKVAYQELVYGALRGMLQSLDPHSQFLDADMFKDMKDDTAGQFGGLGIVISMKDDALTIVSPMEDTPGYRAGLQAGDQITAIDGQSTLEMDLSDAVKLLRGAPGTKVTLTIARESLDEPFSVEIERANIEVASVKDARLLDDGIGYIRVTQFSDPTADALQKELDRLQAGGLRALVLDLRNNPGGLLSSAIAVSEKFLGRNQVIVSTQGRHPNQSRIYRAKGNPRYPGLPIVILVNGGSASASEIVAGALQDNRRAVLVGEKTFGKGSVQSVLPMEEGTAIRLTTAKYYTPSQRVIHERGIEPDIVVPMQTEDLRRLRRSQMLPHAPADSDASATKGETPADVEDIQLQRAVDVLKGILKFTKSAPDDHLAARSAN